MSTPSNVSVTTVPPAAVAQLAESVKNVAALAAFTINIDAGIANRVLFIIVFVAFVFVFVRCMKKDNIFLIFCKVFLSCDNLTQLLP